MGTCKDLSEFDRDQNVKAGQLGQSISNMGCFGSAVVSMCQSGQMKEQW